MTHHSTLISFKLTIGVTLFFLAVLSGGISHTQIFAQEQSSITQPVQVSPGWNLLSLPVDVTDGSKNLLFPVSSSQSFTYQGGYRVKDTLHSGAGFWIKFDSAATISIPGEGVLEDTIELQPGWNIIGALTVPIAVSAVQTIPSGIITSEYYAYTPGEGYATVDTLRPGIGHWIKANQSGSMILSTANISSIVREQSIVIDESQYNSHLIGSSPDGSQLIFDASFDSIHSFQIDDILIITTGDGLLRKIINVEHSGGNVILTTDKASLSEVVAKGSGTFSETLTADSIASIQYFIEGVHLEPRSQVKTKSDPQAITFSLSAILYDDDGNLETTGDQVRTTGSFEVGPTVRGTVELDKFKLSKLELEYEFLERLDQTLDIGIFTLSMSKETTLAKIEFTPFTILVSGVPVIVTPTMTIKVGANLTLQSSINSGIRHEYSFISGLRYENEAWSPYSSETSSRDILPTTLNGSLDAKIYFKPELEFKIYGSVSPYLYGELYGEFEANIAADPWWKLYGGLDLGAGVRVEILDKKLFDYYGPLLQLRAIVAQADGPFPGGLSSNPCPGMPTVNWGKTYHTIMIGNQCWLEENLDVGNMIMSSQDQANNGVLEKYCYDDIPTNCDMYGGLYQWNEAMQYSTQPLMQGICPLGWRLPDWNDLLILKDYVGSDGNALKESGVGIGAGVGTNTSGFSALLAGLRESGGTGFQPDAAFFWTSTDFFYGIPDGMALGGAGSSIYIGSYSPSLGLSVRCLKNPVQGNSPPTIPSNPSPFDNAQGQASSVTLTWNCNDPDGNPLTYDIYFGTEHPPSTKVSSNQTGSTLVRNGLLPGTQYYWRVVAKDDKGNSTTGPRWRFTTASSGTLPTVTTTAITSITTNSASSGGNITSQGTSSVTARGVCWSTLQNPTIANSKTTDGAGTGVFTSLITGLSSSTTYYVRAYATNSVGTSYGAQVSFTTSTAAGSSCPGTPSVTYLGITYPTVQIGSQCWLKKNLNVGTRINGALEQTNNSTIEKYCYDDNLAKCDTFGGLYQWDEAMQYTTTPGARGICPAGWHIPTIEEFQTLGATVSGDGNSLKAIGQGVGVGVGTNTTGFSALLSGFRTLTPGFAYLRNFTAFLSSTEDPPWAIKDMELDDVDSGIHYSLPIGAQGHSVRCIKD
jgi:uncharacterized protein (TIGR02145 family)